MNESNTPSAAAPDGGGARSLLGAGLLLALFTLAIYWPAGRFEFNNFDDQDYVSENALVQQGLTWAGVKWAFTTGFASNWHPLTWLSHMLDCQLFGVNPGAHHLVNVMFHVLNTLLLFVVLQRMTGFAGRSGVVAALFALHPLHVESVAWIAERKDVLSGLFWMLTLLAYVRYVEKPRVSRYLLVVACFAGGLMAKPMVVTLPFVLLLLDFWPLRRWPGAGPAAAGVSPDSGPAASPQPWSRLLLEKAPLFVLTIASCVVTLIAQGKGGAVESLEKFPLGVRLGNALVAYVSYVGKTLVPENLAVLYPHPGGWPVWMVAGAGVLLGVLTLLALAFTRRRPYLLVGWLWYLGTLVPVIGLVQVGAQYMADRYSYLPLIGVFVALTWTVAELLGNVPRRQWILGAAGALVLLACAAVTSSQLPHWRNSVTLFSRAVNVTTNNAIAHYNLAQAFSMQGQHEIALRHYEEALRIKPAYDPALNNLGLTLVILGRITEATNHYAEALRLNPRNADARFNYGVALNLLGQPAAALAQLTEAVRLAPDNAEAHHALGRVFLAQNDTDAAATNLLTALQLRPEFPQAHFDLGASRLRQGRFGDATVQFAAAARLAPDAPEIHAQWGIALAGDRKPQEAVGRYREALRLNADYVEVLNNLAWLLATHPNAEIRNGAEAVRLAERACERTAFKVPMLIGTLAAAYAEAGRFGDASKAAIQARELARTAGQTELAAKNEDLLKLFQAGQPYREGQETK